MLPSRRDVIAIGSGTLIAANCARSEPDASLHITILDHVSIAVSNVQKSLGFYSRLFGNDLRKENDSERFYVKLGASYLAMAQPGRNGQAGRIDHFCAGFDPNGMAHAKARLTEIGIKFAEPPPFGLFFPDPEGIRVQMWTQDSWKDVGRTTSSVSPTNTADSIFKPIRLDHLVLAVADIDKQARYYTQLFGPAIRREKTPRRVWFGLGRSRLALTPVEAGGSPRIDSFRVTAAEFKHDAAAAALRSMGAEVKSSVRSSIRFRDADGIQAEVIGARR